MAAGPCGRSGEGGFPLILIFPEFFHPPGTKRLMTVDWEAPRRPFTFKDERRHFTTYGSFLLGGVVDIASQACQACAAGAGSRGAGLLCAGAAGGDPRRAHGRPGDPRAHAVHSACLPGRPVLIIEIWFPSQPSSGCSRLGWGWCSAAG